MIWTWTVKDLTRPMVSSGLQDHDITNTGHVVLVKTLDVEANVVTSHGSLDRLVVHLDGEDLAGASGGGSVGGEEDNFISGLDGALLDTASEHISDTLDLEDTRDGGTHGLVGGALGNADHLLESILEAVNVDGLAVDLDVDTVPPRHVGGLGDEVITLPARDGEDGD